MQYTKCVSFSLCPSLLLSRFLSLSLVLFFSPSLLLSRFFPPFFNAFCFSPSTGSFLSFFLSFFFFLFFFFLEENFYFQNSRRRCEKISFLATMTRTYVCVCATRLDSFRVSNAGSFSSFQSCFNRVFADSRNCR